MLIRGKHCMAALHACSHVNTDNAESFGSLKKLVKQEERGMKTSVLKMASSTLSHSVPLPLFLLPSLAPLWLSAWVAVWWRWWGVAIATCQEETVLQCKSPHPPPGPPLFEISEEDPASSNYFHFICCVKYSLWFILQCHQIPNFSTSSVLMF